MKVLRLTLLSAAAAIATQLSGCCGSQPEMKTGPRPESVRGWQESQVGAVTIKGQFVLNKGESVDNGRFGIRVIDINPGRCHLFDVPDFPTTKLQFYKVPDQTVICEWTFKPGSGRLDLPDVCGNKLDWSAISINEINYKENWVFFDLR